jgi:hypothetical protein
VNRNRERRKGDTKNKRRARHILLIYQPGLRSFAKYKGWEAMRQPDCLSNSVSRLCGNIYKASSLAFGIHGVKPSNSLHFLDVESHQAVNSKTPFMQPQVSIVYSVPPD